MGQILIKTGREMFFEKTCRSFTVEMARTAGVATL